MPLNIALEILYTGDFLDAQEAKRLNLVNRVVPHEQLMAETDALVRGMDMTMEDRVRFAEAISRAIRQSADAREGLAAFREKRQPVWQGR